MSKTPIEWTQATWNPIGGCMKVSPGCKKCYAIRVALRLGGNPNQKIQARYSGLTQIEGGQPNWTGKTFIDNDVLLQPLKTRKPTTYFISLSDLFYTERPDEDIDRVFAVMALTPHHTYQILTKYAERMLEYFKDIPFRQEMIGIFAESVSGLDRYKCGAEVEALTGCGDDMLPRWRLPLPNVHLGVSAENQQYADERIPLLLKTPAAIRFVSYEPALDAVDFIDRPVKGCDQTRRNWLTGEFYNVPFTQTSGATGLMTVATKPRIDWIIVGGESGPGARPFHVECARQTIAQCKAAGVPCFFKQAGAVPVMGEVAWLAMRPLPLLNASNALRAPAGTVPLKFNDKKGGDMAEWPEDLRVRQYPEATC